MEKIITKPEKTGLMEEREQKNEWRLTMGYFHEKCMVLRTLEINFLLPLMVFTINYFKISNLHLFIASPPYYV